MLWLLQGFALQPALVLVTSSNLWLVLYSKERCMYDVSVDRGPNTALTCRGGESSGILYHNVAGQASHLYLLHCSFALYRCALVSQKSRFA